LEQGANFVLITSIDELHQSALNHGIRSVDVSSALSNSTFPLPDKLTHINEAGNGALAWEIVNYFNNNKLIPARHLNP